MKSKLVAIALLLATAGCGQEAPPAPSANPAPPAEAVAAPAPAPVAVPAAEPVGDAVLSVAPGSFRACEATNGAITATAKWDASSKGAAEVAIYVESPGNERKLWLNGGATGESTTGNWVFDQTIFTMVERGTEKPLSQVTVKAVPCE